MATQNKKINYAARNFADVRTELVDFTGNLYIGYDASVKGIIAGIIWGFVDGFVGGALLAWVYNKVS